MELTEQFWLKVDKSGECWLWTGAKTGAGYGLVKLRGQRIPTYVHRAVFEASNGPIPTGLTLDHLCRNRACCNPSHLEAVSRGENVARGASPTAVTAKSDRCQRGHLKSEAGTYTAPNGLNECRQCRRDRRRAWTESHRDRN